MNVCIYTYIYKNASLLTTTTNQINNILNGIIINDHLRRYIKAAPQSGVSV